MMTVACGGPAIEETQPPAAASPQEAEQAVRQAEQDWSAAVVAMDIPRLEQLYADDLIYGHSSGVVDTKTIYLEKLKSGAQHYTTIDREPMQVHVYGDSAVTFSKVRMTGTNASGPFDNSLMLLHAWVKIGEQWRMVAHQTAQIESLLNKQP
jgi:ketosteroid isomerase-like protein